ncbi:MAG: RNA polymerase sigma factor [Pirellulales bacterium]
MESSPADAQRSAKLREVPLLSLLYERHRSELVRYARRTFGSGPPDPEDVAQAAFTHFAALAQPELVENPRAFLYRSARNFVIDQNRRALVRTQAARRGDLARVGEAADELDAERVLDGRERLHIIEGAIREMPRLKRDALILHRIEELSYAEISVRLGVSQTTVKRLVGEAVLWCLRALREAEGEL